MEWRDGFLADMICETMAAAKPSQKDIVDRSGNILAHRSLARQEGVFS